MERPRPPRRLALAAVVCGGVLLGGQVGQAGLESAPPAVCPAPFLSPQTAEVGLFFKGARLRVSGPAGPGESVVIVARGRDRSEDFSRKHRWGPIWISSGRVQVSGAPSVWLVFSSQPVEKILNREAIRRHQLDRAAMLEPIRIHPEEGAELLRTGYFDLKRSQELYAERAGTVQLRPAAGGGTTYSLECAWPRSAPPATYQIRAYLCHGGEVVGTSEAFLEVRKVGLPKLVAEMSTGRASLYGLLCILAAAAAGFGMDRIAALFGGKRVSH